MPTIPPPGRLAFVDLETTGATGANDRITEIGIVRVGPEGTDEWSSLVNPQVSISSFITQLTGISNSMVAKAPVFSQLAAQVRERLAGHLFIAHNARFDYGFIKHEYQRLGERFRAPVLCTVKLSRKLYPQHYKHNLDALIERHALRVSDRHRALGDARLIQQFWQLHAGDEAERLHTAVHELTTLATLPAHLDATLDEDLPEGRGVYVFYDSNDALLFVGRSKAIRRQVLTYFVGDKMSSKRAEIAAQVARIECFPTEDENASLLLEADLRKRVKRKLSVTS